LISVDANKLFTDGFSQFLLPRPYHDALKHLLDRENWLTIGTSELKAETPWNGRDKETKISLKPPVEYLQILQRLAKDPRVMSEVNHFYEVDVSFLDCWNGAENLSWHWDGADTFSYYTDGNGRAKISELFFLIYFNNESEWKKEWGGELLTGKRPLSHDRNDIIDIETIYPSNRAGVLVNNMNPCFVHKTNEVNKKSTGERADRITLHVGLRLYAKN